MSYSISPAEVGLPFDESLARNGAPLITAGGMKAVLVSVDETAPESFRLKVLLEGQSYPRSFCGSGRYRMDGAPDEWDLRLAQAPLAA